MDNLLNIKEKSKELFKKNIQDSMISFLKIQIMIFLINYGCINLILKNIILSLH